MRNSFGLSGLRIPLFCYLFDCSGLYQAQCLLETSITARLRFVNGLVGLLRVREAKRKSYHRGPGGSAVRREWLRDGPAARRNGRAGPFEAQGKQDPPLQKTARRSRVARIRCLVMRRLIDSKYRIGGIRLGVSQYDILKRWVARLRRNSIGRWRNCGIRSGTF